MKAPIGWIVVLTAAVTAGGCGDDAVVPQAAPVVEEIEPAAGPTAGGTTITVIGKNFGTSPAVIFGGNPTEVMDAGDEQILARLPEGEGSVEVEVEAGARRSEPRGFTYHPPSIDDITPAAAPTPGGVQLTIHGKNFGLTPQVTVGGEAVELESWTHWEAIFSAPPRPPGTSEVELAVGGQSSGPTVLTYECPQGEEEREGACVPSHDFDLTIRIGDEVIRANDPLDEDPSRDRIVLEGFRPGGFGDHLLVDGLLVEVEIVGPDEVIMRSTSTLAASEQKLAQFAMGGGGTSPYEEITVTLTADLSGYFGDEPADFGTTVHLAGDYLPVDDQGGTLAAGDISYAWAEFGGELETGASSGPELRTLGTVAGDLVRGEPGPVPFAPPDMDDEFSAAGPTTLRGELRMQLGPRAGIHHPVSAELRLRRLPD